MYFYALIGEFFSFSRFHFRCVFSRDFRCSLRCRYSQNEIPFTFLRMLLYYKFINHYLHTFCFGSLKANTRTNAGQKFSALSMSIEFNTLGRYIYVAYT